VQPAAALSRFSHSQQVPQDYSTTAQVVTEAAKSMALSMSENRCGAICRNVSELEEAEIANDSRVRGKPLPEKLGARKRTPKPHQTFVAEALMHAEGLDGLVVAHGLGSGKTITGVTAALAMLASGKCDNVLIIAPAMLIAQWRAELTKYISMKDVNPPADIRRAIENDADILSKIRIVSYNAFGNKYRKIITDQPYSFDSLSSSTTLEAEDETEEAPPKKANSHKTNIEELENVMMDDPDGSRQRLKNAFLGTGLVVDEAHRLVRGFARLWKGNLRKALADRGADRGAQRATSDNDVESLDPESMEVEQERINYKLSYIQTIVDCLELFAKRVLLTATPAPNEPEDFGRISAIARGWSSAPDMVSFTMAATEKDANGRPTTKVFMSPDAVRDNVGAVISYYPSTPLPGEAAAFPKLMAEWVYVPMTKEHEKSYLITTGELIDPNAEENEQLTMRGEQSKRARQQIAKRLVGIWNKPAFLTKPTGAVNKEFVLEHFPKMAVVMNHVTRQTFKEGAGPVIIYVEYESCIADIVRCIRAYSPGAFDLNAHMDTLGRLPWTNQSKIEEYALRLADSLRSTTRETGKSLRFFKLTSKTSAAQRVLLQSVFTRVDNADGDLVRILIMTSAGCEGLDLKWVKQVHILAPPWTVTRVQQVVGRAVRYCSHPSTGRDVTDHVKAYFYMSVFSQDDDSRENANRQTRERVYETHLKPFIDGPVTGLPHLTDDALLRLRGVLEAKIRESGPMQEAANLKIALAGAIDDFADSETTLDPEQANEVKALFLQNIKKIGSIRTKMTTHQRVQADAAFADNDHTAEQETWTKLIRDWYSLNAVQDYVATLSIDCPLHHGRIGIDIDQCVAAGELDGNMLAVLGKVSAHCKSRGGAAGTQRIPAGYDVVVDQSARFMGMPSILAADAEYDEADMDHEDMDLGDRVIAHSFSYANADDAVKTTRITDETPLQQWRTVTGARIH
jgi:superfamily II DNA or RNA helicase